MQYTISDYPIVIEPTTESIEAVVGTESAAAKWVQLLRIDGVVASEALSGLVHGIAHFFGQSASINDSAFVLGYTSGGRLSKVLQRQDLFWDVIDIPEEVTGEPVSKPSVRVVFKTLRARAVFIHYLEQVRAGKIQNPALAVVLDQLDGPPLQIDVWRDPQ